MTPREIGKILKEAREKQALTLSKIWSATRVQSRIVEALEGGTAEDILGRVYALLFLKKYAAFLGLDSASLVEDYKASRSAPEKQILDINKKPTPAQAIDTRKWTSLAALAVALFVSVYLFFLLVSGLKSFYRNARKARLQQTSAKALQRETAKKMQLDKSAQKIFPIPKDKPIKLTLKGTDLVWVKIWGDGKVVFEGTLAKGATKSLSAKNKLMLWAGRAEALEVTINEIYVGKIGKGNIKNIEISRDGLKAKKKWLIGAKK